MQLDVKAVIKKERTPSIDGEALGSYVIEQKLKLRGLVLDVSNLAPEDLVSSFVNSFLNFLEQRDVNIEQARSIVWHAQFRSESDRLRDLVNLYIEDSRREAAN